MPKERIAGTETYWTRFGPGTGAPALALHCALAHGGAWVGVATALGDRLDIVAPDMPGHGRSEPWHGGGDYHDRMTAIARHFLSDGTTLLGHSFGATIALRIAQESPDRVRSLVLIEPVLFAAARLSAPDVFAARRAASAPMMTALAQGDAESAARGFTASWGTGQAWDEMSAKTRARIAAQMPIVGETQAVLNDDTKKLLDPGAMARVAMPVLMIRGGRSEPIMAAIHAQLCAMIPQARDVVIEGAGHMVPISHPDAVAREIAMLLEAD